jgi:hypothetical protein
MKIRNVVGGSLLGVVAVSCSLIDDTIGDNPRNPLSWPSDANFAIAVDDNRSFHLGAFYFPTKEKMREFTFSEDLAEEYPCLSTSECVVRTYSWSDAGPIETTRQGGFH